ncbi:MAG: leucyl/phenylalanyl-tRNA--protein transferase [Sulfurimonadaceae bacterium]|jgi:leucyl/phenylalanyl-tRNA--protein transferase|nr:leucyl/phenylalanyl-tRNA--protein transferase [Sulfurimonadaceae bacterium]
MLQIPKLNKYDLNFPDARNASADGIIAWGGDLNPSRLLRAYREGIFPWYSKNDPILWWSPDPRFILELSDFKLRRSLRKSIHKFTYNIDTAFVEVMQHCAATYREGQSGTWINDEMIESYEVLHSMQKAHSIETYYDGKLVGGLYGLSVGNVFCGESMFSHKSDASKAALAVLIAHLKVWGYDFIDAQVPTAHLESLGAKEVSREDYLRRLAKNIVQENEIRWELDTQLIDKL